MKLIKFKKDLCAPCSTLTILFREHNIKAEEYDIFEHLQLGYDLGITSLPTTILYDEVNNEVLEKWVGIPDRKELKRISEIVI